MTVDLIDRAKARLSRHETEIEKLDGIKAGHEQEARALVLFLRMAAELMADEPLTEGRASDGSLRQVVTPSSDESLTGREVVAAALPATISPATATEAGGSNPLADRDHGETRVRVPPGLTAKGGPTGMGRSDGEERTAMEGGEATASPPTSTLKERILALHAAHPDWHIGMVARELGVLSGSASNAAKGLGIDFPKAPSSIAKPNSAASRVAAYHRAHPEAHAGEIAAALGIEAAKVRQAAVERKSTIRKMSPEERSEAQRAGQAASVARGTYRKRAPADEPATPAPNHARKFVRPDTPAKPPEEARAPIPAPAPAPAAPAVDDGAESLRRKYGEEKPAFEAGDEDADYVHPSVAHIAPPKGTQYRLMDRQSGLYLHQDLNAMTDGPLKLVARNEYPWKGSRIQMDAVRRMLPATVDLVAVEVGEAKGK